VSIFDDERTIDKYKLYNDHLMTNEGRFEAAQNKSGDRSKADDSLEEDAQDDLEKCTEILEMLIDHRIDVNAQCN
jgi:hypothetical protein